MYRKLVLIAVFLGILFPAECTLGAPEKEINPDARCAVCGMFVAKYVNWACQVHLAGSKTLFFDGVKDLMVFYHNPGKYGKVRPEDIQEIWVKDYYSQQWIDGEKAFYVVGSDVYGPMGKEFIPFTDKSAAENFLKDHMGKDIMTFNEITDELVQSMRSKMKMMRGTH